MGQFPPLFNWLHPSPAAAPSQLGSSGAAGPHSALVPAASPAVAGETEMLKWGPSSSALESMLFIYWLQYTHSSILFYLTYICKSDLGLKQVVFLVGCFFCIFEGKKPDTNVH